MYRDKSYDLETRVEEKMRLEAIIAETEKTLIQARSENPPLKESADLIKESTELISSNAASSEEISINQGTKFDAITIQNPTTPSHSIISAIMQVSISPISWLFNKFKGSQKANKFIKNNYHFPEEKIRLDVSSPEQVFINKAFDLAVSIKQPNSPVTLLADLPKAQSALGHVYRPESETIIRYRVEASGDNCKITPPFYVFLLKRGENTEPKYFQVTCSECGKKTLLVSAFQEDEVIAAQTRTVIEVQIGVNSPVQQTLNYSGLAKIQLCERLQDDWIKLADLFEIPVADRRRFKHGLEPQGVWEWLECRQQLSELSTALNQIKRSDLAQLLQNS
ncbi:MAG: hypothetical protein WAQ53_08190 [Thiofilum sp.]|uniref:hypothetical protein n=1 Tax=Thiofilum sp. TaxID=2212733 RepID=UPI0025F6EFF0|nr:hypothetical protein [Thiofilum sp.]MBK8453822.1 hypothetical protein [Thiofilum sp.]